MLIQKLISKNFLVSSTPAMEELSSLSTQYTRWAYPPRLSYPLTPNIT